MGASSVDLNSQDSVVPASEPRESSRPGGPPRHTSSEYCEEEEDERNSWPGGRSSRSAVVAAATPRGAGRLVAPSPASGLPPRPWGWVGFPPLGSIGRRLMGDKKDKKIVVALAARQIILDTRIK
jgi:hypothetical protein